MITLRTTLLALTLVATACKPDDDTPSGGTGSTDPTGPVEVVCPGDDEVRYVSDDPQTCMVIRYACQPGESFWSDPDCGCGCELPDPEGQACGGIAGLRCADGYFCSFPAETRCGSGDQMGTCTWRPEMCITLYKPVCGCDGQTYSNSCTAAAAGVSVASDGACEGSAVQN